MTNSSMQMKAVTIPEFGTADVLRLDQVEIPAPGPGEVAIDVAYAGANFARSSTAAAWWTYLCLSCRASRSPAGSKRSARRWRG